jgi:hypothetical protein
VRELTVAEYRTILSILAHPNTAERERIRLSGLPSSTYNVVRRRAYDQGWLSDILIPNPGPCGFAAVELRLTRPPLSAKEEILRAWTNDPECVLLWAGLHAMFGVFFLSAPPPTPSPPSTHDATSPEFRVRVEPQAGSIPVYFDYSGLWARFGGQPPPPAYPSGLDTSSDPFAHRALVAASGLLRSGAARAPEQPRWTSLLRFPRSPRRALEEGAVQPRTVLDIARLPAYDGRRIGEFILIQGTLRAGATVRRLLNFLTGECGVYPFLVAESGGRLILAGVGQMRSEGPGRVPVPSARRPVLAALTEEVDPADLLIEPVEAVDERVRQRYPVRLPALHR